MGEGKKIIEEKNAQPAPKVTSVEQSAVEQQLGKTGEWTAQVQRQGTGCGILGGLGQDSQRPIKCSMASALFVTAGESPCVLGDAWEKP